MLWIAFVVAAVALLWTWILSLQLASIAKLAAEAKAGLDTEKARVTYLEALLAPLIFIRRNPERFKNMPGVARFEGSLLELISPGTMELISPGTGIDNAPLELLQDMLMKWEDKLHAEFASDDEAPPVHLRP